MKGATAAAFAACLVVAVCIVCYSRDGLAADSILETAAAPGGEVIREGSSQDQDLLELPVSPKQLRELVQVGGETVGTKETAAQKAARLTALAHLAQQKADSAKQKYQALVHPVKVHAEEASDGEGSDGSREHKFSRSEHSTAKSVVDAEEHLLRAKSVARDAARAIVHAEQRTQRQRLRAVKQQQDQQERVAKYQERRINHGKVAEKKEQVLEELMKLKDTARHKLTKLKKKLVKKARKNRKKLERLSSKLGKAVRKQARRYAKKTRKAKARFSHSKDKFKKAKKKADKKLKIANKKAKKFLQTAKAKSMLGPTYKKGATTAKLKEVQDRIRNDLMKAMKRMTEQAKADKKDMKKTLHVAKRKAKKIRRQAKKVAKDERKKAKKLKKLAKKKMKRALKKVAKQAKKLRKKLKMQAHKAKKRQQKKLDAVKTRLTVARLKLTKAKAEGVAAAAAQAARAQTEPRKAVRNPAEAALVHEAIHGAHVVQALAYKIKKAAKDGKADLGALKARLSRVTGRLNIAENAIKEARMYEASNKH